MKIRDWPIARVTKVHPGDDGVVRVADITCRGKTYRRPVVKLILALTDEDVDPSNTVDRDPSQTEHVQ